MKSIKSIRCRRIFETGLTIITFYYVAGEGREGLKVLVVFISRLCFDSRVESNLFLAVLASVYF